MSDISFWWIFTRYAALKAKTRKYLCLIKKYINLKLIVVAKFIAEKGFYTIYYFGLM